MYPSSSDLPWLVLSLLISTASSRPPPPLSLHHLVPSPRLPSV
uniref:Uncharacterized protein n=1 Tax=Nelumbo nucifera TaxID=4432 RepID=A0A822XX28_NELNU|nr:TPA_asm: hypothetical protein HUJ06_025143 [Nelumbo nucifera]